MKIVARQTGREMTDLVIDNWIFGMAAVDERGHESPVVFPTPAR